MNRTSFTDTTMVEALDWQSTMLKWPASHANAMRTKEHAWQSVVSRQIPQGPFVQFLMTGYH